jgi:predicted alpha/beta hydrolase
MPSTSKDLTIHADDRFALAATLFEPAHGWSGDAPLVVIGSAAGVRRSYYAKFADFVTERGSAVLTFDYRGIGGSRPQTLAGFEAGMRDWGIRDISGVLRAADAIAAGRAIHWIGHSYGGFGVALARNHHLIQRLLCVATLEGHWRNLKGAERYRAALGMSVLLPVITRLCGYMPGRMLGSSEDLPKGVLLEWARWIMRPSFLFDDPTLPEAEGFATFRAPIRFVQIEDDIWATQKAVAAIAARFTAAAEKSYWAIRGAEMGGKKIGHLGFFRAEHRETLWPAARDWILPEAGAREARA